jgi:hypothetical protein
MALDSPDGEKYDNDCVRPPPQKSAARSSNNASVTQAVIGDVVFAIGDRTNSSVFPISVLKVTLLMRFAANAVSDFGLGAVHSDEQAGTGLKW